MSIRDEIEAKYNRMRAEIDDKYAGIRGYSVATPGSRLNQLSFQQYQMDAKAAQVDFAAQMAAYNEQQRVAQETKRNAADAYRTERMDALARMMQDIEASRAQLEDIKIQSLKQRASARAASGEVGVQGASVDSQMADMRGQEGVVTARMERQREMSLREYRRQQESILNTYKSRINSVQNGIPPSTAALAVRLQQAAYSYNTRRFQNQQLTES